MRIFPGPCAHTGRIQTCKRVTCSGEAFHRKSSLPFSTMLKVDQGRLSYGVMLGKVAKPSLEERSYATFGFQVSWVFDLISFL